MNREVISRIECKKICIGKANTKLNDNKYHFWLCQTVDKTYCKKYCLHNVILDWNFINETHLILWEEENV